MSLKSYNRTLFILNFSSFLQYQRFIMPISFLFYLSNGLTLSDFILFQSIFNITCLLAKIPMGFLGDIFSKKYLIITSYIMFTLRVLLWIFFSGFWTILTGEILYGLFKALFRGNVDSYIYELLRNNNVENKMLSKYGKLSLYTSMGSAISCIAGAIMYKYLGFKSILIVELIFQIIAVGLLCFIPNLKSEPVSKRSLKSDLTIIKESILRILKNKNINYFAYYSALLTGLTGVFVWNFQPLLKASAAPVILFGIVSFVNQSFRGLGGWFAHKFVSAIGKYLISIEYIFTVTSFLLLIIANYYKNYILSTAVIILISFSICLFVVFNVFTVSKIHENTPSSSRASTSSVNTFLGDFAAFAFLLMFKFVYDYMGIIPTQILFLILSIILLFPGLKKIFNKLT